MSTIAVPNLPESAPFTPKQRAWLNGFFAGLVSTGRVPGTATSSEPSNTSWTAASVVEAANSATTIEKTAASWRDVESDDVTQYAWHNPEISIDDRVKLAEGKSLDLRLMAAMAQLNCGQCGYLCRTYAKAIETGEESDLKKCAPGGKKTSRLLVQLGCHDYRMTARSTIDLLSEEIKQKAGLIEFYSMTVRAFKLDLEDRCEDYGQLATYLGTIPESPNGFVLEEHHLFEKGKPLPVCGNTAAMLRDTRYGEHFQIAGNTSTHFGLFDCGPTPTPLAAAEVGACC